MNDFEHIMSLRFGTTKAKNIISNMSNQPKVNAMEQNEFENMNDNEKIEFVRKRINSLTGRELMHTAYLNPEYFVGQAETFLEKIQELMDTNHEEHMSYVNEKATYAMKALNEVATERERLHRLIEIEGPEKLNRYITERLASHKRCPTCKRNVSECGELDALSRRDNKTMICSECATQEALSDYANSKR
jgi:hypothetical protein